MGANLTWTALWLTLCAMHNHHGFWPEMLHFTLDNTSGHTHVIIDHIFGVITVGCRSPSFRAPRAHSCLKATKVTEAASRKDQYGEGIKKNIRRRGVDAFAFSTRPELSPQVYARSYSRRRRRMDAHCYYVCRRSSRTTATGRRQIVLMNYIIKHLRTARTATSSDCCY